MTSEMMSLVTLALVFGVALIVVGVSLVNDRPDSGDQDEKEEA